MYKLAVIAFVVGCAFAQQQQFEFPPFMQGATAAQKQAYQQLVTSSGGLTEQQMDQKVRQWINTQGGAIQTAFNQFDSQVKAQESQAKAARDSARAKMSPAAKDADDKLYAISSNPSLTIEQKGQQIQALYQSLPANVRQELESIEGPQGQGR